MASPRAWHKAFVNLPPEWRVLTYFQRSLMQDYWRLSDADCSGRIEVAGDPVQFLVRMLDLSSKGDRGAAVRETTKLFKLGLLVTTQVGTSVTNIEVRTAVLRRCSSVVPPLFHTQVPSSVPNTAGTTQDNSSELLTTGSVDREKEEIRKATRQTNAVEIYQNSYEDLTPVWAAMCAAYSIERNAKLSPAVRKSPTYRLYAADILSAARENAAANQDFPEHTVESVLRVTCRAFYASLLDDWAKEHGFPLKILAEKFSDLLVKGRFKWQTDPDWALKPVKPEASTGSSFAYSASYALVNGASR